MSEQASGPGRPSKYKPEFVEQALNLSLLGLTNEEMARYFNIAVSTLHEWRNNHPEFSDALKEGKDEADGKVAKKLYAMALEGNVTAMIFWLKNRKPNLWRDHPQIIGDEDGMPAGITVTVIDGRKSEPD